MSESPTGRSATSDAMSYAVAGDLAAVRAFVCSRALALGLPEQRVELLTLAVSELATNTLQHTTGGGRVRVWAEPGRLVCEVADHGGSRPFGRQMPPPEAVRGRGLAIVERVCDGVQTIADPEGILVRVWMAL